MDSKTGQVKLSNEGKTARLVFPADFKIGGVWGGETDQAAYAEAVRLCRG